MSDTGKRQARFFKTKEEALGEVQRLKVRKENHGTAAKLLTPADEQQAASAIKLLRDKGITLQLSEVVGDYISRWELRNTSVTLQHAFSEYLKSLKRHGRSEVHRQSIENVEDRFAFAKDRLVADLKPSDIEKGLDGAAPSYRNAVLVRIRGVLNYGMKGGRKWLAANPANDCEVITRKLGEVGIYSVEETGAIMATTARLHPDLVPALALMTFAGIRPDHEDGEIVKLKWDHLILKDREKRVELPSTITKTGKRRTIKVRPALASWLQWHKDRTKGNDEACKGLVCPIKGQKLRTKLREIFNDSKVKRIQDGLRHSFASYLAPIDGLDKVEAELGHIGGREVLNRHYRSDVRATVAKKFWAMRAPQKTQTKTGKILQFKAA
jgi:integrase